MSNFALVLVVCQPGTHTSSSDYAMRWFGDRSANVTTKGSNTHHVEVYNPE